MWICSSCALSILEHSEQSSCSWRACSGVGNAPGDEAQFALGVAGCNPTPCWDLKHWQRGRWMMPHPPLWQQLTSARRCQVPGAEPVVGLAKLGVAEDTLQPLKPRPGCWGTISLAWAEPARRAGACGLAHTEPTEMPTWQEASKSSSALPSWTCSAHCCQRSVSGRQNSLFAGALSWKVSWDKRAMLLLKELCHLRWHSAW